jgi:hypothetical protein
VKVKHVKEKKLNLEINAHLQKSNGIEIGIEFINKLYNEKFKQFLDFY